jgi:hypothetical protein
LGNPGIGSRKMDDVWNECKHNASGSGQGPVIGSWEHGNEPLDP